MSTNNEETKVEEVKDEENLVITPNLGPNRKQRRYETKRDRQAPKTRRDTYHWHRRIVNEMKENSEIQKKIMKGKFDYFLGNPDTTEE